MTTNTDKQTSEVGAPVAPISASAAAHPERRVTVLAVLLAIVGVGLVVTVPDSPDAMVPSSAWLLPVLAVGFAVAEFSVFRVHLPARVAGVLALGDPARALSRVPRAWSGQLPLGSSARWS